MENRRHGDGAPSPFCQPTATRSKTEHRMNYFLMMGEVEQRTTICRLVASGLPTHTVATATALSVEIIDIIVGGQRALEGSK
jgi:hypothetical protein